MKILRLLLSAATLLGVASEALAGSYTITTTTNQDTRLDRARLRVNSDTCTTLRDSNGVPLPPNCTQAQARAIDPTANIYSDVGDFLQRFLIKTGAQAYQDDQNRDDTKGLCSNFAQQTRAQQLQICTDDGIAAANCPTECR